MEGFEVGKITFPFLHAEKLTGEAVREDHRRMSAAAILPHACTKSGTQHRKSKRRGEHR
jgi:hypothetical protein